MGNKQQRDPKATNSVHGRQAPKKCVLRAPRAAQHPANPGSHKPRSLGQRAAVTSQQRHEMIARVAYLRAAARGFGPGRELEDWYAAQQEVDRLLASEQLRPAELT